jgi:hypothetical protein
MDFVIGCPWVSRLGRFSGSLSYYPTYRLGITRLRRTTSSVSSKPTIDVAWLAYLQWYILRTQTCMMYVLLELPQEPADPTTGYPI